MSHHRRRGAAVWAAAVLTVTAACTPGEPPGSAAADRTLPTYTGPPGGGDSAQVTSAGPATSTPSATGAKVTTEGPGVQPVDGYAVSAGHPEAVAVGMAALAEGGTAVDAAVATAFAVSVVEPFASGVGGGGAALVHSLGAEPVAYDYREVVADDGRIPDSGVGVPGFVAGLERLHADHGRLEWAALVAPSVTLAEEGVTTSQILADQVRAAQDRLDADALPQLFPSGEPLAAGDALVQPDLADTLRAVADGGSQAVYEDALGGQLTAVDGIDAQSLAAYEVTTPLPPTGQVGPYRVVGAAPPLTGVTLIQMLQMAAARGATEVPPASADFVDAVTVAWRRASEDLLTLVGDPAYVDVPLDELTDPGRNADKVAGTPVTATAGASREGDGNTTHITVVDQAGTMVSMTNTVTNFWGSGQEVGGFFLNDQLRRFELGEDSANAPEPGKRSVSYSSPTIVTDDRGRPVLGLGSPGGSRIPNVLTQVILRWGFHDVSLQQAVDAVRFHAEGDVLYTEPLADDVAADLTELGYQVEPDEPFPYYFGSVQALEVDYDARQIRGAQDGRRAGSFAVAEAPG